MSIVKMQRIAVLGLEHDKKRLISELMKLGVVEITEQKPEDFEESGNIGLTQDSVPKDAEEFAAKVAKATQALEALSKFGQLKEPLIFTRRRVKSSHMKEVEAAQEKMYCEIEEILKLEEAVKEAENRINRASASVMMLRPWQGLDIDLGKMHTKTADITLGVLPKTEVKSFEEAMALIKNSGADESFDFADLKQVSDEKDFIYVAMISGKAETAECLATLKNIGFSEIDLHEFSGTATENLEKLNIETKEAEAEAGRLKAEIAKHVTSKEAIEEYADLFRIREDKERIREKLLRTKKTFMLEGWMPQRMTTEVSRVLEENGAYYKFREPGEEEEVPVLLENKSFFAPTEVITQMYSLPAYRGFDPTSIYSLFYIVFFGMMFSDAGYGLLLAIGCGVILKKFDLEGTMQKMMKLFFYCGISTVIWGALFGGFFGDLIGVFTGTFLGKEIAFNAIWFNPLEDPMKLLIFSLILGVIHLFIGMGIQAYMQIKDGQIIDAICDEFTWYVTIIGLAAWLCGAAAFDSAALATAGMWMSIIGAIGLVIAGARGKKGFGMITGAFANLYNITSWISDILSYARLLALGLATGVIAQVVNTMGSLFGGGIAGLILFVLIFAVGHAINFAINMLGAFIHSARLQYVEFFGKFYIDGGEPFEPFRAKTKYIRIENE